MRDGIAPPPSRVPRVDDGTTAWREEVLRWFSDEAGVAGPDPGALPRWGTGSRGALVSAIGDDGNEVAGVLLPVLTAPAAVHTGWNVRPPLPGRPALMPDFLGSRLALAGVAAADIVEVEARRRAAAEALVENRLLLPEDVDVVLDAARVESQPESHPGG